MWHECWEPDFLRALFQWRFSVFPSDKTGDRLMQGVVMIAILFQYSFIFLAIYAAVSDYQRLKIPNWISLTLCAMFLIYALRMESWADVGWHIAVGAGVFLAAVISYSFGVFGGGDVKMIGAVALWAGPERSVEFAMLTGLLGGALGVLILVARFVVRSYPDFADRPGAAWNIARWGRDGTCPYGIPIAMAAVTSVPAMFVA
jgi:prepilin peptidase CpaA